MKEVVIKIDAPDLLEFYGVNERNIKILRDTQKDAQIYCRGDEVRIVGEIEKVIELEDKINFLLEYSKNHDHIPEDFVIMLADGVSQQHNNQEEAAGIILHGRNGKAIIAKTPNQKKLVNAVKENEIVFAIGPAGTGKTYTSVALAVKALKNKEIKKIILTRPAVEAGENLGFLPGDMREKIDPYLRPLYDALDDMLPADKLAFYLERKIIEIAPLAFMRGRTLDEAYVILDEAQNCSNLQLKMFLTRMGPLAKFIVNGDLTQIDLPSKQSSGLITAINLLKGIKGIDIVEFDVNDVTRHRIVKEIIKAYSEKSLK